MKMYFIKNKIDGEIIDILASSLESAQKKAAELLNGNACDYIERF